MRRWAAAGLGWGLVATLSFGCGQSSKTRPLDPNDGSIAMIRESSLSKVDLLLTIDNSRSMKDKQELLANAVPYLLQRLIAPRCIRYCGPADNCTEEQVAHGIPIGQYADPKGACPSGVAEMPPVRDLHVGVISSSLGSHGAAEANDRCTAASDNDHAQLLGTLRNVAGTFNDLGFLAWDVSSRTTPAGTDFDPTVFVDKAQRLVQSAGSAGCELPATLEAWYRFLIDPEPPVEVVLNQQTSVASGLDQTLLQQRSAFLRPDSVVVIGMLSDANDCSVMDEGQGWMVAHRATMHASTSACLANPDDPCCTSCTSGVPPGCSKDPASDPNCQNSDRLLKEEDDAPSLRCWQQKRRFGMDLLYPIERYVNGLTARLVPDREGQMVQNPLYAAPEGKAPRDRGLVNLMAIVGVPWQDLADNESLTTPDTLRYLTTEQLAQKGRWDLILGAPGIPVTDPLMVEQPEERSGINPITGEPMAPSDSMSRANRINGHELANIDNDELQYACIFPLSTPRNCDTDPDLASCECTEAEIKRNSPLCQPPEGGASGPIQYFAKAHPGTRFLDLIQQASHEISTSVASVCPKVLDESKPSYGYLPAVDGLMSVVRTLFRPRCFSSPLPLRTDGSLDGCGVLAAFADDGTCDCAAHGNADVPSEIGDKVRAVMQQGAVCDVDGAPSCSSFCVCQVPELTGNDLAACQNDVTPPETNGFCYINAQDNEPHVGNPDLLRDCAADQKRHLRLLGDALPEGAQTFVNCDKPFYTPRKP